MADSPLSTCETPPASIVSSLLPWPLTQNQSLYSSAKAQTPSSETTSAGQSSTKSSKISPTTSRTSPKSSPCFAHCALCYCMCPVFSAPATTPHFRLTGVTAPAQKRAVSRQLRSCRCSATNSSRFPETSCGRSNAWLSSGTWIDRIG